MEPVYVPYTEFDYLTEEQSVENAQDFFRRMSRRRTVREFSDAPIPREVIEQCLLAAGRAPSGANLQPWHFVVVSNREIKKEIRRAAEQEEKEFYTKRAPKEWLEAIAHLGTDEKKPYLEEAPCLIVVFVERNRRSPSGDLLKNYYATESVGLATGFLITALHLAGIATLTHTPSPMGFLNKILRRPSNERPFMILVAGYPKKGVQVPKIEKKPLSDFATFI